MIGGKQTSGISPSGKDQDGQEVFFSSEGSCEGGAHTLICCTHIFLHIARAHFICAHPHIFMRAHSRTAHECEKGVCSAHVVSLNLAFSILMSHHLLSLLFLDGYFRKQSWLWRLRLFLQSFTRPKSAEEFDFLAKSSFTTWSVGEGRWRGGLQGQVIWKLSN